MLENVGSYDLEDVGENGRTTRSGTSVAHAAFIRTSVAVRDINYDIGAMLAVARYWKVQSS